ncbi:hypothetical protein SAM40697_6865 [Streptomyces ambofaciens]|uniref:Uncharacterized protein n=1 Tax=Streptomyces ambofaciens TaxID=1889 RepID=Q0JWL4_STRAM|nr:hypothetical protein SAM40697_0060 [Streptomyces ambofaciens]ANB10817.1 hypothetical protein SAM40697_6865 [Streptomyces ambofaciens]CAK50913.1 hypothetical protein DSMT0070 [Streptomyces ambofaciens]CAK51151.1 hypothetical protein DSMT0070 [Streptomyces ambofaciens]
MQWSGTELLQGSEWFTGVAQSVIVRRVTMGVRRYVGRPSTVSSCRPGAGAGVPQIGQVLPDRVEMAVGRRSHLPLVRRRFEG